jgi:hypothetical protein
VAAGAVAAAASSSSSSSSAGAAGGAGAAPSVTFTFEPVSATRPRLAFNPVEAYKLGLAPLDFKPPAAEVAVYEAELREEAYNSVEGLAKGHAYAAGAPATTATSSMGAGASSMRRHMRVAAEMAALPSLAVHWASSVLVRSDEESMDTMRAIIMVSTVAYLASRALRNGCCVAAVACSIVLPPHSPCATVGHCHR